MKKHNTLKNREHILFYMMHVIKCVKEK